MKLIVRLESCGESNVIFEDDISTLTTMTDLRAFSLTLVDDFPVFDNMDVFMLTMAGPLRPKGERLVQGNSYEVFITKSPENEQLYMDDVGLNSAGYHEPEMSRKRKHEPDESISLQIKRQPPSEEHSDTEEAPARPAWMDTVATVEGEPRAPTLEDTVQQKDVGARPILGWKFLGFLTTKYTRSFSLNSKLAAVKLSEVLCDKKGREVMRRLETDDSYCLTAVKEDRCLVKRILAEYLLNSCYERFRPDIKETREFVRRIFEPYPSVDVCCFIGRRTACLEQHIRQVQQRLKTRALYKPRNYTRHCKLGSDGCIAETACELLQVNTLPMFSAEHLDVLEKTRIARLIFCKANRPALAFERYNVLTNGQVLLEDFCAKFSVSSDDFPQLWLQRILPAVAELSDRRLPPESKERIEGSIIFAENSPDRRSFIGLLKLMSLFYKSKHKDLSRYTHIFNSFPREHSAAGALKSLSGSGVRQPAMFSYGDCADKFYIAVEGRDITVTGGFAQGLLLLVAVFYIFDLVFDEPVRPEMLLLDHFAGIRNVKLTESGKEVLKSLNIDL